MELRYDLEPYARKPTSLKRHMEAAFAIDETCDVLTKTVVWPFLLMLCTHWLLLLFEFSEIPQTFQHIAKFNDSSPFGYCLTTF